MVRQVLSSQIKQAPLIFTAVSRKGTSVHLDWYQQMLNSDRLSQKLVLLLSPANLPKKKASLQSASVLHSMLAANTSSLLSGMESSRRLKCNIYDWLQSQRRRAAVDHHGHHVLCAMSRSASWPWHWMDQHFHSHLSPRRLHWGYWGCWRQPWGSCRASRGWWHSQAASCQAILVVSEHRRHA